MVLTSRPQLGWSRRCHPILALGALGLTGACGGDTHRVVGTLTQRCTASVPITAVDVQLGSGALSFVASTAPEVEVEVEVLLRTGRPDSDFVAQVERHLHIASTGGALRLEDAHLGTADADDWQLHVTVRVPDTLDLAGRVQVGGVAVAGVGANDLRLHVGAGTITLRADRIDGACRLAVGNGQIDAEIGQAGPGGGLVVECTNGAVRLGLPADVRGRFALDVRTGGLDVAARYGLRVEREVTAAQVRGEVGRGGPSFEVRVGTGTLDLR